MSGGICDGIGGRDGLIKYSVARMIVGDRREDDAIGGVARAAFPIEQVEASCVGHLDDGDAAVACNRWIARPRDVNATVNGDRLHGACRQGEGRHRRAGLRLPQHVEIDRLEK